MGQEEAQRAALLKEAVALHQAGKLDQAAARYRQVLALAPRQFDALHLLGVVARQQGDAQEAVNLIRQALAVGPAQAAAHCNLGAALQDLGSSQQALASYDMAVRLDPGHALAWSNRGNALRKLGRLPEAVDSYERALNLRLAYPEAWCNRAIALLELGEAEAALASSERALREKRAYVDALFVRGNALFQLRRFGDALASYDAALASDARSAEAHGGRAMALQRLGRAAEALASIDRAIALRPEHAASHQRRADALLALERKDEAIEAYRSAYAKAQQAGSDTDMGQIAFALATLGAGATPERAPQAYVKALFDQYAGHFDQHLTQVLAYRTPALLEAALRRRALPGGLDTVDLGCGTGLCAPFLRPLSRVLTGIDLSGRMLERARATSLYDRLACCDIGDFLAQGERFDLVHAADVLVYFGDLAALFGQVHAALRPGGHFCFSAEASEAQDFVLLPSSRFGHSLAYLARLAGAVGFEVVDTARAALRAENGVDVMGHVVVMRRRV